MEKNFKSNEEKNSNAEAEKKYSATDSVKIFADEDLGSLYADNETFFKLIKRLLHDSLSLFEKSLHFLPLTLHFAIFYALMDEITIKGRSI